MCNARPELASAELPRVRAPTLLIVEDDEPVLDLNRGALAKLRCPCHLEVLPGKGGLALHERASQAARLASEWFRTHLLGNGTAEA